MTVTQAAVLCILFVDATYNAATMPRMTKLVEARDVVEMVPFSAFGAPPPLQLAPCRPRVASLPAPWKPPVFSFTLPDLPGSPPVDWATRPIAAPVDVRAENRRAIDRLLASDRSPFATARRRAVVGFCESHDGQRVDTTWQDAEALLKVLDAYEAARGGAKVPSLKAYTAAGMAMSAGMRPCIGAVRAYETARGMK